MERFAAIPGVKPEAKNQAQAIARSCSGGDGKSAGKSTAK
jgi:hypothetical protein